jgi:hypothetical protein
MNWVVQIKFDSALYSEWWISHVHSYNKKQKSIIPWIEMAFKYKRELSARKAAEAFGGIVKII